jgi:hypothetical protein
MPMPKQCFMVLVNGTWSPISGGKIHTYDAGTTTPKATYTTAAGNVSNANPVVLNARGEPDNGIFLGAGSYKIVLKDADDATIWTMDNISGVPDATSTTWCGTAGGTADALTLTPATPISAYTAGQTFEFICAQANTGAVTAAISGLAARAITWNGTTALAANDLVANRIYKITDDGTRLQLHATPYAVSLTDDSKRTATTEWVKDLTATEARTGIVELATTTEATAGTDTERAVTPAGLRAAVLVAGTAQATTSGTSIDFTSIPSWVKKITVMVAGVSTNGSSLPLLQIGDSDGVEDASYTSLVVGVANGGSTSAAFLTAGFQLTHTFGSGIAISGSATLSRLDSATNTWVISGSVGSATSCSITSGSKALSATLDRVRLTTVNGTDTFDAGSVNILYE